MHGLRVDLSFEWETVLRDGEEEYFFPQPITKHMRRAYRGPAVYRWNIYDERPTDKQLIYIGQTQELSPDRIRGYLKPGPSQKTNQRLLSEFNEYLEQGIFDANPNHRKRIQCLLSAKPRPRYHIVV